MGSITVRTRKDGSLSYKAQVRIKRDGVLVFSETETFDRKAMAQAWMKKRETELSAPGAIEAANSPDPTLAEIMTRYMDDTLSKIGRTKGFSLRAVAKSDLGAVRASEVTSQRITDYIAGRARAGTGPATLATDMTLLGSVFDIAGPAWGYRLDRKALDDAKIVCARLGYTGRSNNRKRRPTLDEMDAIMAFFKDAARRRPWAVPMVKIVPFALFSTRRMEEILRIRWDGLDHEKKRAYITDVKHPRRKIGNHKWAKVPDEAWEILISMPRIDDRVFPFHTDAVGAQFTRACQWLEIEDLHFHDLRHEGVSRLFEMDWPIPRVAEVSLHDDWGSMRRYTHLNGTGDKWANWKWLPVAIAHEAKEPRKKAPPVTAGRSALNQS